MPHKAAKGKRKKKKMEDKPKPIQVSHTIIPNVNDSSSNRYTTQSSTDNQFTSTPPPLTASSTGTSPFESAYATPTPQNSLQEIPPLQTQHTTPTSSIITLSNIITTHQTNITSTTTTPTYTTINTLTTTVLIHTPPRMSHILSPEPVRNSPPNRKMIPDEPMLRPLFPPLDPKTPSPNLDDIPPVRKLNIKPIQPSSDIETVPTTQSESENEAPITQKRKKRRVRMYTQPEPVNNPTKPSTSSMPPPPSPIPFNKPPANTHKTSTGCLTTNCVDRYMGNDWMDFFEIFMVY